MATKLHLSTVSQGAWNRRTGHSVRGMHPDGEQLPLRSNVMKQRQADW
jgi:hypothetical protein